jgi:hypothetical protein
MSLHRSLVELLMLGGVSGGEIGRRLAFEQLSELVAVDKKIKGLNNSSRRCPRPGSSLMELPVVGPVVAARIRPQCEMLVL